MITYVSGKGTEVLKMDARKHDVVGGLIWVILGICLCVESIKLKIILGGFHIPGAGFMPFLAGTLLGILGFILIFCGTFKGLRKDKEVKVEKIFVKNNWKHFLNPLLNLLILIAYVLLLEPLGFLLTTFLFLFLLLKLSMPKQWLVPLVLSISAVIISHLVFSIWLQCHFPRGIFRF